jgi:hypothetical protein
MSDFVRIARLGALRWTDDILDGVMRSGSAAALPDTTWASDKRRGILPGFGMRRPRQDAKAVRWS